VGYQFDPEREGVAEVLASGCHVVVRKQDRQVVRALVQLVLDLDSPLTPRSLGGERIEREGPEASIELKPGVWWCEGLGRNEPFYLRVEYGRMRVVSKAQAYCELGAVGRLIDMGLEDAAIALQGGDFDHASVQVIAERERIRDQ
jgi:hypothetical protein